MASDLTTPDPFEATKARVARRGRAAVRPEALDAEGAAQLLCISKSKFLYLDREGAVPAAVKIGQSGMRRWLRSEMLAWLRAGSPSRAEWETAKRRALYPQK